LAPPPIPTNISHDLADMALNDSEEQTEEVEPQAEVQREVHGEVHRDVHTEVQAEVHTEVQVALDPLDEALEEVIDAIFASRFNLRDAFRNFDVDNSGTVTAVEFRRGLHSLGLDISVDHMALLLEKSDVNGDGQLQYDEFVSNLRPTRNDCDAKHQQAVLEGGTPYAVADAVMAAMFELNEENIWQTFKEFDGDGNGWISKKEMKQIIKQLDVVGPMGMSARDFNALWKSLDDNGDGRINWIEWLEKMKVVKHDVDDRKKYE